MGNRISEFQKKIKGIPQHKILMVGLNSSGKTTLLYRMMQIENIFTIPTIGFNVETISHKNS